MLKGRLSWKGMIDPKSPKNLTGRWCHKSQVFPILVSIFATTPHYVLILQSFVDPYYHYTTYNIKIILSHKIWYVFRRWRFILLLVKSSASGKVESFFREQLYKQWELLRGGQDWPRNHISAINNSPAVSPQIITVIWSYYLEWYDETNICAFEMPPQCRLIIFLFSANPTTFLCLFERMSMTCIRPVTYKQNTWAMSNFKVKFSLIFHL